MTGKERCGALSDALDVAATRRHKKNWAFCTEDQRVEIAREVFARRPELAPSDYPSIRTIEHDPNAAPRDRAAREQAAARRYGFSEADVQADPLKASLVAHIAQSKQRASSADEFTAELQAVGKRHGLDPTKYAEKLQIAAIMARAGHPLASGS